MDEDTEQLQQRQQYLPHNKKKQQQIVSELFQYDLQRGKIKDIIAYYYEGNGSVSGNWLKQIELWLWCLVLKWIERSYSSFPSPVLLPSPFLLALLFFNRSTARLCPDYIIYSNMKKENITNGQQQQKKNAVKIDVQIAPIRAHLRGKNKAPSGVWSHELKIRQISIHHFSGIISRLNKFWIRIKVPRIGREEKKIYQQSL